MSEPTGDAPASAEDELLAELVDDFSARVRRGERPAVEDYIAKYPALAERIRKVLAAVAMIEQTQAIDSASAGDRLGSIIGRYKLLERIGEGGFGVVYMAEQNHPVRRKVALKIIKPGMDSRQVLARFEAERQALAIMDHPNIAKVLDAGATDSGHPYFVMELVKGEPVTEYCDRNQLEPRQRLELFVQVCHAVQHAHQKGIIHRDIKPSNVLVSVHDTTAVVKVIDFGVAKALGQELTEKTLFTGFAQLVGTPLYMSPEQAGQSSLDVDTRSDIYSLGVLLYELLTGSTPFDKERFKKAAEEEIRRIIREEEPPKPSTRLSSAQTLPSVAAQRGIEPAKLTKLVRGELDWIVMKALEKERTRRYETANGLARDIDRYLQDEPVEACPPSASYRLRKFARRNKATLVTVSIIGLAVLFAVGSFGWALRDRSARQAKVAGQVDLILSEVDQLQREQKWPEALVAARRAAAVATSGDADTATERRVRKQLKDLEFIDRLEQIRMQHATWVGRDFDYPATDRAYGEAFRQYGVNVDELAIETSIARLKSRPAMAMPLAAALDVWTGARKKPAPIAGRKRLIAIAQGIDPDPLRNRIREAFEQPEGAAADNLSRFADSIDVRAQRPETLNRLAAALERAKQEDAGLRLRRAAQAAYPNDFWVNYNLGVELAKRKEDEAAIRFYTAAVALRPNATAALNNLGLVLAQQKAFDESVAAFRKAIEIDPKFNYGYTNLGSTLSDHGKLDEAIVVLRKGIEVDPKNPNTHNNLGSALWKQGKLDEAIAALHKAIEVDPQAAHPYANLGSALIDQGKLDEAVTACRRAIELDPKLPNGHGTLGRALLQQKKFDEAIAACRVAIELDPKDATYHHNVGSALYGQKKLDEALAAYQKAIELNPKSAATYTEIGNVLGDQGKGNDAMDLYRKAIELNPAYASAYNGLGNIFADQGKVNDAIAAYQKAIELDPKEGAYRSNLGRQLSGRKEYAKAVECFQKAIELNPKDPGFHFNLGHCFREIKQYDKSAECFRKVVELDPKVPLGHFELAKVLRAQKKFQEAATAYRKVIELAPLETGAHNSLGILLCDDLKDYGGAIECFRKVIELDPKNANGYQNLSAALGKQEKPVEELAALEKALELDPQNGWTCERLASRLLISSDPKLRNPERALVLAKKAVERDPTSLTFQTLGWAFYRSGDWAGCVAAMEKSIQLQGKGDPAQWYCLALAQQKLGHEAEAREVYGRAAEYMERTKSKASYYNLFRPEADEAFGANDPEKAVAALRRAVEANPKDVRAHVQLGNGLRRQGSIDEAIGEYREAIRLEPKDAGARGQLASVLTSRARALSTHPDPQKRDPVRAIAVLTEVAELTPDVADTWHNLGVAQYAAGNWSGAVQSLEQYRKRRTGDAEWTNPFYLAMAHWQLNNKDEALRWYDTAVKWMDAAPSRNTETMKRVRIEAAGLLGVDPRIQLAPSTSPATSKPQTSEK